MNLVPAWDVMLPLEGTQHELKLCTCLTPEALAATIKCLAEKGKFGPKSFRIVYSEVDNPWEPDKIV